jgi:IS5 family transposase
LDVESVAGGLLPQGGMFAFLAEHRRWLFPPVMFEDLFPSGRGRPSIAPDVVAAVIVLQTLHGLSDREAADAVTFDLRWKAACGVAVDAGSFHPSTLTYWRRRLAASERPHRIFEVVRQLIIETGAVSGRNRRALDSTVLDDAVARQDTVTQLIAAIRRVARDVPGAAEVVTARCTGHDYRQPGKPSIAWDDEPARDQLVSALVNDALAVLAGLDVAAISAAGGKAAEAVALLALVAGQDVEPAEGSEGTDGRWRIARQVRPDRVISTVDPQARHAHKSQHHRQDGFKAHLVIEPDTGLATGAALTQVNGPENSDASVGARLLDTDLTLPAQRQPDPTVETEPAEPTSTEQRVEVLGDSAYGTGPMLAALDRAGRDAVIKPRPLRSAVQGGFTLDDFAYDPDAGTLTCPNQITRRLTTKRTVRFGTVCVGCPLRERCTTSPKGRLMLLDEHESIRRANRQRAQDPAVHHLYRTKRPLVERSIAWLVHGNRRVPYRGVAKNNAWLHHRVAALNLRRLLTLGLAIDNGSWQIT